MFLEYWMIAVLFVIFAYGLYSTYYKGWNNAISVATHMTIQRLAADGIISLHYDKDGKEMITKALPSEEEFDKIVEIVMKMKGLDYDDE